MSCSCLLSYFFLWMLFSCFSCSLCGLVAAAGWRLCSAAVAPWLAHRWVANSVPREEMCQNDRETEEKRIKMRQNGGVVKVFSGVTIALFLTSYVERNVLGNWVLNMRLSITSCSCLLIMFFCCMYAIKSDCNCNRNYSPWGSGGEYRAVSCQLSVSVCSWASCLPS